MRNIQIMDTTLRDGEQTRGVSFLPEEKLHIAQNLLMKCGVDRIEIASCKVGGKDQEAIRLIMDWAEGAGYADHVEVLSFVDKGESIAWLKNTGCKRLNLLTKGSRQHCEIQLGKTPVEHYEDIISACELARREGYISSVYLEDWSRGIETDKSYVMEMLAVLSDLNIERVYLCDTLGVLSPRKVTSYVAECCEAFPDMTFEYHGHNDYGLATANAMAAVEAGAQGLHVTVNGLGERTGNASLAEIVVALRDFEIAETRVNEKSLLATSRLAETYSQKQVAENAPIIGRNAFTHMAGVHMDGQAKGGLYESRLAPERFGRSWEYGLSKLSGKKTLENHLKSLDSVDLSVEEQKKILQKIHNMSAQKIEIDQAVLADLVKEAKQ